jgi:Pheromone A receptor
MYWCNRFELAIDFALSYLVPGPQFYCSNIRWYYSFSLIINVLVIFLRHWLVRRKRLNDEWALGMRNGISKVEFRRLQITVLSVICVYFPFSFYVFAETLKVQMIPYSWDRIRGPLWPIILLSPMPKATLGMWIGPALALSSFLFVGTTRNARKFYEGCVEWIYNHLPKKLRAKLPFMRKISDACRESRKAGKTLTGEDDRNHISMVERYAA